LTFSCSDDLSSCCTTMGGEEMCANCSEQADAVANYPESFDPEACSVDFMYQSENEYEDELIMYVDYILSDDFTYCNPNDPAECLDFSCYTGYKCCTTTDGDEFCFDCSEKADQYEANPESFDPL